MYTCPVCGFNELPHPPYVVWPPPQGVELRPPYVDQLGNPSYQICDRCDYEFGFDDDPGGGLAGASFEEYRSEWMKDRLALGGAQTKASDSTR